MSATPSLSADALLVARAQARHSWQAAHELLANIPSAACTPAELGWLGVYHVCVHEVIGEEQSAVAAHLFFQRLCDHLRLLTIPQAPTELAAYACLLAWLHGRAPAVAEAQRLLEQLDYQLYSDVQRIAAHPVAYDQAYRLQLMRYFSLRLPVLPNGFAQYPLLAALLGSTCWSGASSQQLGLTTGLVGELLAQNQLHRAGVLTSGFEQCLREGIQQLLRFRRTVDFTEQRYSVFPYQFIDHQNYPVYDAELTWRHGDLGAVLLLHTAYELLHDTTLLEIAELVGLNAILRTSEKATQVVSTQFYRGATGIAHLYQKLYRASGQSLYQQSQFNWLHRSHDWLLHELGTGFYRERLAEPLHGLVGVCLVHLSALSDNDLRWDMLL